MDSTGRSVAHVSAIAGVLTAIFTAAVVALIIIRAYETDGQAGSAVALASLAAGVLGIVFGAGVLVTRASFALSSRFPWVVGVVSFVLSWSLYLLMTMSSPIAPLAYRGLHVPQGEIRFWDLSLVLKSVDCASWGFDVYAENSGCLQDPSIYGPGTLWVRWIPFMSESNAALWGTIMMALSSLVLLLLARWSTGLGQLTLLAAAVGGPWLLLLERGNLDASILWVAAVIAVVAARPTLARWWGAAALIWIIGTWKYYPFAMGLMLLPALRLRRGWTVIAGFAVASIGFVLLTLDNLRLSAAANTAMATLDDFVVLGRLPLEARMSVGLAGTLLIGALIVSAIAWGAVASRAIDQHIRWAVLALGGAVLYLVAVAGSGFGYGYKATLLLTAVPLLSRMIRSLPGPQGRAGLIGLGMVAVSSVVVWNTTLATLSGLVAASLVLGVSSMQILRFLTVKS